jgi:hypothetical protein
MALQHLHILPKAEEKRTIPPNLAHGLTRVAGRKMPTRPWWPTLAR